MARLLSKNWHTVTDKTIKSYAQRECSDCGKKNKFWCTFCSYPFQKGDLFNWLYTNDQKDSVLSGNPKVCLSCYNAWGDEEGLLVELKKRAEKYKEFENKFWWFIEGDCYQ